MGPFRARRKAGYGRGRSRDRGWNSPQAEPHLVQRDASQQAVGRGQRVDDLEMVEPGAFDQLDRIAVALGRGGELARLALELVALELAEADRHRAGEIADVMDRAQIRDLALVELQIVVTGAAPHRLEIVDAAAAQRALDDV